jgi:hypothetical protein
MECPFFETTPKQQKEKLEEKYTWITCPTNALNKLDEEILTSHPW